MMFYIYVKKPGEPSFAIGSIDYSETADGWPFTVQIEGVGKHSHPGVNKKDAPNLQSAIKHFETAYLSAWAGNDQKLGNLIKGAEVYLSETRPAPAKVSEPQKPSESSPKVAVTPSSGTFGWGTAALVAAGLFWAFRRKKA